MQSHQFDTCKICNEIMKKKPLYQYMEIHQEKRSQYECEQCDKSYATKFSLSRHVRTHSRPQNTPVVMITAKKHRYIIAKNVITWSIF